MIWLWWLELPWWTLMQCLLLFLLSIIQFVLCRSSEFPCSYAIVSLFRIMLTKRLGFLSEMSSTDVSGMVTSCQRLCLFCHIIRSFIIMNQINDTIRVGWESMITEKSVIVVLVFFHYMKYEWIGLPRQMPLVWYLSVSFNTLSYTLMHKWWIWYKKPDIQGLWAMQR